MPEKQPGSGEPAAPGTDPVRAEGSGHVDPGRADSASGDSRQGQPATTDPETGPLRRTPLHALHLRHGAQMAPFAGYDMPIQYGSGRGGSGETGLGPSPGGILGEHRFTRASAGLFDVSHMGPAVLRLSSPCGDENADWAALAAMIERLVPSDIAGLAVGEMRYTHLLSPDGGVLDDLMVGRLPGAELFVVVNAARKDADFTLFAETFGAGVVLDRPEDAALLALQGPAAEAVLAALIPGVERLAFMRLGRFAALRSDPHSGVGENAVGSVLVSRSGYTGEDGFEILLPAAAAEPFAEALLADPRIRLIGLGARDSLRLEAGLCLYGHDLTPARTPVAAGLKWIIQKRRREAADFPGAARILGEIANGPAEMLVGLVLLEPGLPREGAVVELDGRPIGSVTSGGFGASLNGDAGGAIALAYVESAAAKPGNRVDIQLRNKPRAARVTSLPFVPHRYKRAPGP